MKCGEFRKGCPGHATLNLETGEFFVTKGQIENLVTDEQIEVYN